MFFIAVGLLSLVPIRILAVIGTSIDTAFIPRIIFSSFDGTSSSAEPAPCWKTRSIGQPQFKSMRRRWGRSVVRTSAALIACHGLLAETCAPNFKSFELSYPWITDPLRGEARREISQMPWVFMRAHSDFPPCTSGIAIAISEYVSLCSELNA